jgi:hypothetical protein
MVRSVEAQLRAETVPKCNLGTREVKEENGRLL